MLDHKHIFIFFLFILSSFAGRSQVNSAEKQAIIENRIEFITENLDENDNVDLTAIFDDLIFFYDHPIDINSATEEELFQLYVLSEFQVNALQRHIQLYGKLISIYELQAVSGIDKETIEFLKPFVRVRKESEYKNFTFQDLWKDGNSDLFLRYQSTLEEQEGYSPISEEELAENPNRRFLGNNDRYYLRYRYKYRNNLSLGITAEKDPGEEFFAGSQKNGFDFYSGHLYYQGSGAIRKIALGDYAVNYGQGLTLLSSLAFGKSAFVMNIKKGGNGIRPYTSVEENRFMRGAGVTFGWKNWEATMFYSNKNIDANRITSIDTTDNNLEQVSFSSIQSSGFHRTLNEIEDKDALKEEIIGGNIAYRTRKFKIGVNAYQSQYDGNINRNLQLYNQFELNSNENLVAGIDYNLIQGNVNLFGEASRSQNGGMAFLNGALIALDPHFSLAILHRHFDKDFQNNYANAFAETSNTSNERGLYLGGELKFSRKWNIVGYFDQYKFPWLKFQIDAPSKGHDYLVQLTYKPKRGDEFYVRFRKEIKDENDSSIEDYIDSPVSESRSYFRLHGSYKVSETLRFKTRAEWSLYQKGEQEEEPGFLLYQDLQFKKIEWPVSFSLRYAIFDMASYDSRIYAYENDLLYTWSVPAYYNRGQRFYIMAKWRMFRKTDLWVRYSRWGYNNVENISSGLNEIAGPNRSELKMQLRIRF